MIHENDCLKRRCEPRQRSFGDDFEDEENARKFVLVWQERGKIVFVTRVTTEFVALYEGARP